MDSVLRAHSRHRLQIHAVELLDHMLELVREELRDIRPNRDLDTRAAKLDKFVELS